MRHTHQIAVGVLLLVGVTTAACGGAGSPGGTTAEGDPARRHLLIVLDGLRPDYVTPELMPTLHALGRRGVIMTRHHAVYPTVTRVNASSISTGAYPDVHGLMGNSIFVPSVDPGRFLDTGDRANLLRVEAVTRGPLLTATTLGELLQGAGERLLVASSGSTGSSYLLNHRVAGGAILHYDYGLPETLHDQALERLGDVPDAGTPNDARNRWIVDAFLQVGLAAIDPAVTLMWLSDPDTTAHQHGIGHPTTVEALTRLDGEIQRIQDGLADAGLLDTTNIWVASDHGFSQHTGSVDLGDLLAPFAGTLDDGSPRIVAGAGAIYVRDDDQTTVAEIVAVLQQADGVGAVFTRAASRGATEGWVSGTLSFDLAHWDHERSAQILYSPDWTDAVGEYGYPGTSAQGGVAGHGSTSPFDIHNTLVAVGPDLKAGVEIDVPSGNVDFAPTFLHLLGIDVPSSMQGRVLHEVLRGGPDPTEVAVETMEVRVENEDGSYVLTAVSSVVEGRSYLDYTTVERRGQSGGR
ncbi:MAG: alkaline phosphatase family protein [Acidobacteria bacterium]|nr:MAG: alkaline phosphatase family protein [Acidobacteriota bacterium]